MADATLYGEDLGSADISEGVAGIIAMSLSGSSAYNVLDRLLRNSTNVNVYTYVDITSYAVLANLPADVVKVLPWAGVSNGPTGAMPLDFWQKIGAVASTVVNSLVYVGQLIYDGLVALGTFLVNLAEAIGEWGMRVAGSVQQAVSQAVERIGQALNSLIEMIIEVARQAIQAVVDTLLRPILDMLEAWARNVALSFRQFSQAHAKGDLQGEGTHLIETVLQGAFPALVFGLSTALVLSLIVVGFILSATPVGVIVGIITEVLKDIIRAAAEHWIATIAISAVMEWAISSFTDAGQLPPLVVAATSVVWEGFMIWYQLSKNKPLRDLLPDAFGLFLALMGTLVVLKVIPLGELLGGSKVLASLAGTAISATGLLIALKGPDITPGALGKVDEVLSAVAVGFDIAQTGISVTDCVQQRGC